MGLNADFLEKLLEVFRAELEEQSDSISDALLALETGLDDAQRKETLYGAFRAAHNIKGSARGVDALAIGDIAHRLETLFSALEKRNRAPEPEAITLALKAVDAMREQGEEMEIGASAPESLDPLLDALEACAKRVTEQGDPAAAPTASEPAPQAKPAPTPQPAPQSEPIAAPPVASAQPTPDETPAPTPETPRASEPQSAKAAFKSTAQPFLNPPGAQPTPDETPAPTPDETPAPTPTPQPFAEPPAADAAPEPTPAPATPPEPAPVAETQPTPAPEPTPEPEPEPKAAPEREPEPEPEPAAEATPPAEPEPTSEAKTAAPARAAAGRGEVVRVATEKLNDAISVAEELQITKVQLEGMQAQMRRLESDIQGLQHLFKALPTASPTEHVPDWASASDDEWRQFIEQAPDLMTEAGQSANAMRRHIKDRAKRLSFLIDSLQDNLHMMRLAPVAALTRPLTRIVRDAALEVKKEVDLKIVGDEIELDRVVQERLKDPLVHLLRNAVDHGVESPNARRKAGKSPRAVISLEITSQGGWVTFKLSDDGKGIDLEKVRRKLVERKLVKSHEAPSLSESELLDYLFRPGFSSRDEVTALSGRGVGLDVVRANLADIKGRVWVESNWGSGSTFTLTAPLTLSTERGLLVKLGAEVFALPISHVERVAHARRDQMRIVESRPCLELDGELAPLHDLGTLLHLPAQAASGDDALSAVFLTWGWRRVAVRVDSIVGEQEIVIKPFQAPLLSVRHIKGGSLDRNGDIVLVLDPAHIVETALARSETSMRQIDENRPAEDAHDDAPQQILVVDDSITTRTLEKNILEEKGFDVTIAVDGREAWRLLQGGATFDMVISDIEMPHMTGYDLTAAIRGEERFDDMPIIIVSSLASEENKRRGMEAGADAYIVKGDFASAKFLETIQSLL
ncbi:hybrid sensor histidine kinase/response regulator [Magnetofaba australis]|uniref:Chemotaxis protein CheA n=1 Tax=Magnetofaba australis IT-1 TaxID=1434232 RepID=A0A1Y2JZA2_9PROT|nr:hybrid sensor histidine kinase/response regulator [Magnetofaba australis]OSM00216.1 putative chemotaxis protein CheA [Magnetofaba australis IT-1]